MYIIIDSSLFFSLLASGSFSDINSSSEHFFLEGSNISCEDGQEPSCEDGHGTSCDDKSDSSKEYKSFF